MSDTIKVLLIKPMKPPEVAEIPSGLKGSQATVGGYIEAIYPFEDPVALVCNKEGKINGLPLNRALRDEDGHIYDIVAGDFLSAMCQEKTLEVCLTSRSKSTRRNSRLPRCS